MKTKIIKNNSGISILEVIVAVLIITMSMVGVLSLVIQNIQAQYINKNILIASGLAQEGLELVRNARDLNWLTPGSDPANDWKRYIVGDGTYAIDYRGRSSITNITGIDDPVARLYIKSAEPNIGLYTHASNGGNAPTNFYRLITVAVGPIDATHDYLDVKCKILWREGTENHDYTAETYLYNWR